MISFIHHDEHKRLNGPNPYKRPANAKSCIECNGSGWFLASDTQNRAFSDICPVCLGKGFMKRKANRVECSQIDDLK